jgi:hypothetical protein
MTSRRSVICWPTSCGGGDPARDAPDGLSYWRDGRYCDQKGGEAAINCGRVVFGVEQPNEFRKHRYLREGACSASLTREPYRKVTGDRTMNSSGARSRCGRPLLPLAGKEEGLPREAALVFSCAR